jgi:hypothetical protein
MDVAPDGSTQVARTDTYGAYLWDSALGRWTQLVTISSMPPADVGVDKNEGVYEIRVAPNRPTRLYMAYRGYVYRSDDRGRSWTRTAFPRATMLPNDGYRALGEKMAVDPANADVVYVGTVSAGLFTTTDGGMTWRLVVRVPAGSLITGIVFDATSGTVGGKTKALYVGIYGRGVWKSTSGGSWWKRISGGTLGGPASVRHAAIARDGVYYATATDAQTGKPSGVWRYSGTSWQDINPGGQIWHSVSVDPFDSSRVVLGATGGHLNVSHNRGAIWDGIIWNVSRQAEDIPWLAWTNERYMSNGAMRFDPVTPGRLWFAEGIGVWRTTISGTRQTATTWVSQSIGIEQLVANTITAPPGGRPVLASWDRPLFYSADPDAFPATHGPNNAKAIVMGWAVDHASTDATFLSAIVDWWGVEESGYSTDGGQTWSTFPTVPPWPTPPIGGSIAASTPDNIVWVPSNKQAPYVTTDRGASWTKLNLPGVLDDQTSLGWGGLHWAYYLNRHIVAADRVTAGTFYLYHYMVGLFGSTDGGHAWTLVHAGELAPWSGFNAKLRAVPGHAGHLFFTAGQQEGDLNPSSTGFFMRSTDGGATWTAVPSVLEVYAFGFGKEAPGATYPAIYIAGWVHGTYGLWRSTDEAKSWAQIVDYPLDSLDEVTTVEGDKDVYGTVYAGFAGSGYAYGVIAPLTSCHITLVCSGSE